MSRSDDQRVADILEAAQKLAEIVVIGQEEFERDWIIRSAVERQLLIIGEAVGGLSDDLAARLPERHVILSKGMRTILAHEYHRVDLDVVWQTVSSDVPEFAKALSDETGIDLSQTPNGRSKVDDQPGSSFDESLCGAPTKSGERCVNPAPPRGQRCAAGHRRL